MRARRRRLLVAPLLLQVLCTGAVEAMTRKPNVATTTGVSTKAFSSVCTASSLNLSLASTSLDLDGCEELELSTAHLGIEGAHTLRSALAGNPRVLRRLTAVNLTWTAVGAAGATELLTVLRRAPKLTSLDLTGNWIGDESMGVLSRFLRSSAELQVLRLRWNGITGVGIRSIAQEVKLHRSLVVLDLGGNWIKAQGARWLASALYGHTSLRHLRLDNNGIADEGGVAIGRALQNNSVLQSLELSMNLLEDMGVKALALVLMGRDSSLRTLNLRLNAGVRDAAADSLANALRANSKLVRLDLSGNRLSYWAAIWLGRALREANAALVELNLDDNCPSRTYGKAEYDINASYLRPIAATLAPRALSLSASSVDATDAGEASATQEGRLRNSYWRQVYPLLRRETAPHINKRRKMMYYFHSAPRALMGSVCEQHSWAQCRLDVYFRTGRTPPKIEHGSFFAPFRAPPGSCMRSLFAWDAASSREAWEASYPYAQGIADHTWSEVTHTRDQSGGAWMYLSRGSGVFWNCGHSLRARNKVAAALQLVKERTPILPPDKVKGSAAETLAHLIATDDKLACDKDHCRKFMEILKSNRVDRNDNCYGLCTLTKAPLVAWLLRAAGGFGASQWQYDHMSASSVFDEIVWRWAKRRMYDSVQLTMQPQVWCGLGWTTEMLDLRVKKHKTIDLRNHLGVRDPQSPSARGEPCIVRNDNTSRRTFTVNVYCEGTLMERTARCLADAAAGKALQHFTVYSQFSRPRFDACTAL